MEVIPHTLPTGCQRDDIRVTHEITSKVDSPNEDGSTPLHIACAAGQEGVVSHLLSSGANVNLSNQYGWTPLIISVFSGHVDVANLLIKNGANICARTKFGLTALTAACCGGHLSCVRLLLEYDQAACVLSLQEQFGLSSLMAAALHGHDDVLRLLMDHEVNINQANNITKLTALMLAASNGQKSSVQILVEHGANPNLTSITHRTALDIASVCGKWEVKAYLGDKTIAQNVYGETRRKKWEEPVFLAVKQNNVSELQRLLNMDPDACNRCSLTTGLTPLMQAAILGHADTASLLLKQGANINDQDIYNKWTAIMFAVFHRKSNVVSILLNEQPNLDIRSSNDCTALDLIWVSSEGGPKDLVDMFISTTDNSKLLHGSYPISPVHCNFKIDTKRSFLRRNPCNSSFKAWMSSRFHHLKNSCYLSSLPAVSPTSNTEGLSDEEEDTVFILPDNLQPISQNSKCFKLSSFHFLRQSVDQKNGFSSKQVHPPLLPSPSKWHSPLPKERLPPLVEDKEDCRSIKEFSPKHMIKRYNKLRRQ